MNLAHLVPVALVLTVVATVLFVWGLVTPHWLKGVCKRGHFYYGVFLLCDQHGCHSWPKSSDKAMAKWNKQHEYIGPAGISPSSVILCMNVIALVVSNGILMWCVFRSHSRYWAKNALECTASGVLYGTTGAAVFLAVRFSLKNHQVSLDWSAILVLSAVVLQVLAAGCIYLPLRFKSIVDMDTESSLALNSSSMKEERPSPSLHDGPFCADWNNLMKVDQMPQDRKTSQSRQQTGRELLRMIHNYQQADRKGSKKLLSRLQEDRSNEGETQLTSESLSPEQSRSEPTVSSEKVPKWAEEQTGTTCSTQPTTDTYSNTPVSNDMGTNTDKNANNQHVVDIHFSHTEKTGDTADGQATYARGHNLGKEV